MSDNDPPSHAARGPASALTCADPAPSLQFGCVLLRSYYMYFFFVIFCVSARITDTATEPRRWLSLQDASLLSLLSLMESLFSMLQPLRALNLDFEEGYLTSKCNVPRPAPRVDSNSRSLGSLQ